MTEVEDKVCSRCGERQPIDNFYFVSKKTGARRGECKACRVEVQRLQKDPNWLPTCAHCGVSRERSGPGRRLCPDCFRKRYEAESPRGHGSHDLRLKPCKACGVPRLREDHVHGAALCAVCRSVPQGRRKRLKQFFNMTPREFIELVEFQHYRCAICRRKPRGPWHVDHRHSEPQIVRGLTCGTCNTLIGLARDNVVVLQGAIDYLEAPPAQAMMPGRVTHPEANRPDSWRPLTRVRKAA